MQLVIPTSQKSVYQITTLVIAGLLLLLFSPLSVLAIVGAMFTLYILNSLLLSLGEGVPVNLLIIFLACIQWIIGPILSYYTNVNHPFYGMQVPEAEYFSLALPGVFVYHLGLLLPLVGIKDNPKQVVDQLYTEASDKTKGAYYLIGLGFFSSFAMSFVPGSLFFFLYLLSQLKFVGCFYLYLSNSRSNLVLYIVAGSLVLNALAAAMFHDLLLWGMFFLFIYAFKNKVTLSRRLTFLCIGFMMVFMLQSVKYQYRSIAWSSSSMDLLDKAGVFTGMITERIWSPSSMFDDKLNELAVTRVNQGWIITRVMRHVPYAQPFAEGETVKDAFSAALLPRFIAENKAQAGGRLKMERFTGIILQQGTSMNISLLGEGYGNYGVDGAILFMFLIGIMYSLVLRFVIVKSLTNPTILFWIPFLFLQVIKAETDLATTLNYLVKATIVMGIVFFTFKKVLKVEI